MLSIAEVRAHLARVSYRPGWTFVVYDGFFEGPHMVIKANVENSYQPGEMVLLDIHSSTPPWRTVEDLEDWLFWRLKRIEIHECMEWFKVDGKPVFDPHMPGSDQDLPRRSCVSSTLASSGSYSGID